MEKSRLYLFNGKTKLIFTHIYATDFKIYMYEKVATMTTKTLHTL